MRLRRPTDRRFAGLAILMYCLLSMLRLSDACAQDIQSWNELDVTAAWHHVDLLAPFVARTDPSLPNPQIAATGLTADFHVPRRMTLTAGYLFADLPQAGHLVHIPLIALTETLRRGGVTIADRNRFEKLIGYPGDAVRYRNRLLFDLPFGRGKRAHVFLDDEVFVNLTTKSFNQNRLQCGGGFHFTPRLVLDLYYLEKNPASGSPTHVAGSTLRISLTRDTAAFLPTHGP